MVRTLLFTWQHKNKRQHADVNVHKKGGDAKRESRQKHRIANNQILLSLTYSFVRSAMVTVAALRVKQVIRALLVDC